MNELRLFGGLLGGYNGFMADETTAIILKRLITPDVSDPDISDLDRLPPEWKRAVFNTLKETGGDYGQREIKLRAQALGLGLAWESVIRANPSQDLAEGDTWKIYNLGDTYETLPPLVYLVDKIISMGSLNIFFGSPKSMKTLLLLDLAISVSAGRPWLQRISGATFTGGYKTSKAPVLWLDFENGYRRMHERIGAFARQGGLSMETPFYFVSMPSPWLQVDKIEQLDKLTARIVSCGAKLVVIDHLSQVLGEVEENSPMMAGVMANLRTLADVAEVAIVIIHHQTKGGWGKPGQRGGRAGDTLRGHGSIEANVDLSVLVERLEGPGNNIKITPAAVRGADLDPFGGMFTYTHRENTRELEQARFYGTELETDRDRARRVIREVLEDNPGMNQTDLRSEVMELAEVGDQTARTEISKLERAGDIRYKTGAKNAKQYYLGDNFEVSNE